MFDLHGLTIFGIGIDKVGEHAWVIDFGPDIDLWISWDDIVNPIPSVELTKTQHIYNPQQEDFDIKWFGIWIGLSRRYSSTIHADRRPLDDST